MVSLALVISSVLTVQLQVKGEVKVKSQFYEYEEVVMRMVKQGNGIQAFYFTRTQLNNYIKISAVNLHIKGQ